MARSPGMRGRTLDHTRIEICASLRTSFNRANTFPARTFHEVISPSTHTVFQRAMKSRIVPFSRATDVGALAVESRGATESAGGGSPGIAAASNTVISPLSRVLGQADPPRFR